MAHQPEAPRHQQDSEGAAMNSNGIIGLVIGVLVILILVFVLLRLA